MGQDHGALAPKNRGSEGNMSMIYVSPETAVKQRRLANAREKERESV